MKKSLLVIFTLLCCNLSYSGQWTSPSSRDKAPAEAVLLNSDIQSSRIVFTIPGFELLDVLTEQGPAYTLELEDATPMLVEGAPDLLKVTASVIIPDLANMDVKVTSNDFTDYENVLIAPSKGNLYRDVDPDDIPYTFGPVYQEDAFYPGTLAELRDPYIIRDFRGQTVITYPFQYNPVTRVLRVYHSLEVEVFKVDDNGTNPLIREKFPEKISREYSDIYKLHFLNEPDQLFDYTPVSEFGNMLIISYGDFIPAVQPLADWRIQTGTPCEIVDVATIGSSSQIKTYIADYYNTNGLTFVLLVGDAAQVPTSYASGDSDNNYAYIVGNDHYPDLFIGRFSAETIDHVETQVNRTLEYEQNPDLQTDWFTRGIGIASSQGPGDDNEYDYEHIRNINTDLTDFTYTFTAELFDGSQGGNDAPGNPTPSLVATEVNTGASIITYCGHGSTTSWSSSGFSNTNVNNLTNNNMWPFIWSVACVNGNFVGNTCFAEAWLRATDNGEPTGAVATLMSTINQSWNPPMCGQDEMVDVLVETYPGNINRTFGAASMHGCMQMNDEYGSGGNSMTDTWLCFGDPSLHVRTAFPQTITASYMSPLFIGIDELEITCNANGGTACLTDNGQILATGIVDAGTVTLTFPALTDATMLTLTITAFNYIPLIEQIEVINNIPILVFDDDHVVDVYENNNGQLDCGESVTYTIDLGNIGGADAANVDVILSTSDPYISITDSVETYPLITAGEVVGIPEGFAITAADTTPDQHIIDFTVTASVDDTTYVIEYQASAYAPVLNIAQMIIDDVSSGNGNGRLDPGETATIKIDNFNSGHCPAENSTAILDTDCQYLTFSNDTYDLGTLDPFESTWSEFEVSVDNNAPDGLVIAYFDYELSSGIFTEYALFQEKIGLIFEDWETGDFSNHFWVTGGDQPFEISTEDPYEGIYCAKSGLIEDNQMSTLSIKVEVTLADSLTFRLMTSTQPDHDYLRFYINDDMQDEWSGVLSWQQASYFVTPGTYTFKWVYEKDASNGSLDDCAWIDFITFPPMMSCYAGPDDIICQGSDYQCSGDATNWVSVEWSTSGDGVFDDPTIMDPVYTPGTDDIAGGSVMLTITTEDADGNLIEDEMTLTLIDVPPMAQIPAGPDYVNLLTTTSSEYTTDPIPEADSYQWHVEPVEAGSFSGTETTVTIDWDLSFLGIATITVMAVNNCGEGEYSGGFEVIVDNTTSVAEIPDGQEIAIFPNPNNGEFTIDFSGSGFGQAIISMYDISGVILMRQSVVPANNGSSYSINMEGQPHGIYVVKIRHDKGIEVRKVLIN